MVNAAIGATDGLKALVAGEEDGEPYGAGFVTFKSILVTQTALQMIQYPEPFAMEVLEAPDPEGEFLFLRTSSSDVCQPQFLTLFIFVL
jgi:hypothetical protein